MLDAGWSDDGKGRTANVFMNATKFPFNLEPNSTGTAPTARLKAFNDAVIAAG